MNLLGDLLGDLAMDEDVAWGRGAFEYTATCVQINKQSFHSFRLLSIGIE